MSILKRNIAITASVITGVIFSFVLLYGFNAKEVAAVDVSGFSPGRIIDDSIFTNQNSMSVNDIQAFLNSKVTTCDTNGTQISEYGGGTRAQWGQANYGQSTFTCLKDYKIADGRSSAQLIYDTSQQYLINPQVLIVLLQKEQGLVTDTWPLNIQYQSATGYGCPDTATCDTRYYGLQNQLDWSAKMFRAILNNSPTWYTAYTLGNNYIQYNPSSSCGGSTVNIENRSTQALYNYTPYQPNQATLGAAMGQTVSCGAYGNLNFYRYFISWFGSTKQTPIPGCSESTNTSIVCVWKAKDTNGVEVITSDYNIITNWVNGKGYTYLGKQFYGRSVISPSTGNIPVYSLDNPDGSTFLTTSVAEYQSLSTTLTPRGVLFYADPAGSNSGYDIYRLYNKLTGTHVWAPSSNIASYISNGYTIEGLAFSSLSNTRQEIAPPSGQSLVYRFSGMPGNTHFWTSTLSERDQMIQAGYTYEGVAMRVPSGTTTGRPVYRMYSSGLQRHLYTSDWNEVATLASAGSWQYEGIAWYGAISGTPVYRIYSPVNYEQFYTTDKYERDFWVSRGVFVDNGIAWYQP